MKKPTTGMGDGMDSLLHRTLDANEQLGEPGPVLPWHQDQYGGWHRLLDGGTRVVATVDEYPPDMGGGFFYCCGDGDSEESSTESFDEVEDAKNAADEWLKDHGYTNKDMD